MIASDNTITFSSRVVVSVIVAHQVVEEAPALSYDLPPWPWRISASATGDFISENINRSVDLSNRDRGTPKFTVVSMGSPLEILFSKSLQGSNH